MFLATLTWARLLLQEVRWGGHLRLQGCQLGVDLGGSTSGVELALDVVVGGRQVGECTAGKQFINCTSSGLH